MVIEDVVRRVIKGVTNVELNCPKDSVLPMFTIRASDMLTPFTETKTYIFWDAPPPAEERQVE
jgi:hypothetical protein